MSEINGSDSIFAWCKRITQKAPSMKKPASAGFAVSVGARMNGMEQNIGRGVTPRVAPYGWPFPACPIERIIQRDNAVGYRYSLEQTSWLHFPVPTVDDQLPSF